MRAGLAGRRPSAAAHTAADAVTVWLPPPLIEEWCSAEALNSVLQKGSGYSGVSGTGDNKRDTTAAALADLRGRAEQAFGRMLNG